VEWSARDPRPFAWIRLTASDNDASTLLDHVASALDLVVGVGRWFTSELAQPMVSVRASALPRLGRALASLEAPVVLAFDDVHLVDDLEALDCIAALVEYVPSRGAVAVVGRGEHGLPLARLRLTGHLDEITADDLALTEAQAATVLRAAVEDLDDHSIQVIARRAEGWPAGLYLAGLALATATRRTLPDEDFGGNDRFVVDYVRSEILSGLSPNLLAFLTRTSGLPQLCAGLCDAVLQTTGSQQVLESIERSNRMLRPLDHQRRWYRYHELFAEALRAELSATEPAAVAGLHERAAQWFAANGFYELALEQALAGGHLDLARDVVKRLVLPMVNSGRMATLVSWTNRLAPEVTQGDLGWAILSSWAGMMTGDALLAERWAAVADLARQGSPPAEPALPYHTFRAHLCAHGTARMLKDSQLALDEVSETDPWRAPTLLIHGIALLVNDRSDAADRVLESATEVALSNRAVPAATMALAARSLIGASHRTWEDAERLAQQSADLVSSGRLEEYPFSALTFAAEARCTAHRNDPAGVRRASLRAQRLRPILTRALPWLAVLTRLEMATSLTAMADVAGARLQLREIDDIVRRVPGMGHLVTRTESQRSTLDLSGGRSRPGVSTLTTAELRLLPYLSTHLTFREIGKRQHLSENTIKSHALSVYRKLGVASRAGVVDRAEALGLLDVG
jgi:LuxR family transcriptional regulator, maltose regulon positive regulatory protein